MEEEFDKAVAVDLVPAYGSVVTVVRVEVAQEAGMVARAAI